MITPATADIVNGSFEMIGAVTTWLNVRMYLRHREVKGVFWPSVFFYITWGCWNLLYYPSLDQWWSFFGGLCIVSGNLAWLVMVIWDKWKRRIKPVEQEIAAHRRWASEFEPSK